MGKTNLDLVFRAVELRHALDLREGDGVPVLEPVSGFVKGGHETAFSLLRDAGDHRRDGLLAVDVGDDELGAEVVEDLGVQAGSVGHDQRDVVLPTNEF